MSASYGNERVSNLPVAVRFRLSSLVPSPFSISSPRDSSSSNLRIQRWRPKTNVHGRSYFYATAISYLLLGFLLASFFFLHFALQFQFFPAFLSYLLVFFLTPSFEIGRHLLHSPFNGQFIDLLHFFFLQLLQFFFLELLLGLLGLDPFQVDAVFDRLTRIGLRSARV